jgi:hypothetical protein
MVWASRPQIPDTSRFQSRSRYATLFNAKVCVADVVYGFASVAYLNRAAAFSSVFQTPQSSGTATRTHATATAAQLPWDPTGSGLCWLTARSSTSVDPRTPAAAD